MKVVVDTNIAFSAVLNTNGRIGDLLFNSGEHFTFFSCDYLHVELDKHRSKLLKVAGKMTEAQIDLALLLVLNQITFINERLISELNWTAAEQMVTGIDIDDTDFAALNDQLDAVL